MANAEGMIKSEWRITFGLGSSLAIHASSLLGQVSVERPLAKAFGVERLF